MPPLQTYDDLIARQIQNRNQFPVAQPQQQPQPVPVAEPAQPAAPPQEPAQPTDPRSANARQAGAAGLSLNDASSLFFGSTPEEQQRTKDELAQQYGYDSYDAFTADVFRKPSQTTQQRYEEAYKAAGLPDLLESITEQRQQLTDAEGRIGDNPWLSEASRVGRSKRLQELASGTINNLIEQYNASLGQVNNLIKFQRDDFTDNARIDELRLDYLQTEAERRAAAGQLQATGQFLPDYLEGVQEAQAAEQAGQAPHTVKVGDDLYQWDPESRQFKLAVRAADPDPDAVNNILPGQFEFKGIGEEGADMEFIPNRKLTNEEARKVAAVNEGLTVMEEAEMLYANMVGDEYARAGAGVLSRVKGVKRWTANFLGMQYPVEAYNNYVDSNKAVIAKAMKGHSGQLATKEQEDAIKSLPGIFTDPRVAAQNFGQVRNEMQAKLETFGEFVPTGNYSGLDVKKGTLFQSFEPVDDGSIDDADAYQLYLQAVEGKNTE